MKRSFISMIPRNDLPIPRETSPLAPIRNPESLNRMYIGVSRQANRVLALANKMSQALAQAESGRQPGFSVPQFFYPFKIYQPANYASFSQGLLFLSDAYGASVTCSIDATKPTNLSGGSPTINPTTDAWRFFSVRSGYLDYRPIYHYPSFEGSDSEQFRNNCVKLSVAGTDGIGLIQQIVDTSDGNTYSPPLIYGGNAGEGGDSATQIIFLWVQITRDTATTEPSASLCGYCWNGTGQPDWNSETVGSDSVEIGAIQFGAGSLPSTEATILQVQYGNVTPRYPSGVGNLDSASQTGQFNAFVLNMRGSYVESTSTSVPSDLGSQTMYPGDCVTCTFSDSSTNNLLMWNAAPANVGSGSNWPPSPGGSWFQVI